jgi:hypothetical protein
MWTLKIFKTKIEMNINRFASITLVTLFSILSCKKEDYILPENYESVLLRDLTCGYVLQKVNYEYLEPVNLDEFNVQLEVGKEYWISYENPMFGGYCMIGNVVHLLDIRPPFKNYVK